MKKLTGHEYKELVKKVLEEEGLYEVGDFSIKKYVTNVTTGVESEWEHFVKNGEKLKINGEQHFVFWNEYSDSLEYIAATEKELVTDFKFTKTVKKENEEILNLKEDNKDFVKVEENKENNYHDISTPFEFIRKRIIQEEKEKEAKRALNFLSDNGFIPEIEINLESVKISIKDKEGVDLRNYEIGIVQEDKFYIEVNNENNKEKIYPLIFDVNNITMDGEKIFDSEIMKKDYELYEAIQEICFFDEEYHMLVECSPDYTPEYWLNIESDNKYMLLNVIEEKLKDKFVQERKKEVQFELAEKEISENNKKVKRPKP